MTALAATPQPNDAANATAANPSSTDLSRIWSGPLPSPSLSEPRIVSGPVQKTSEETTKPSMKRARSAEPGLAGQAALQPAAEALDPLLEPQQRPDDPADQQRAEHDQHRRAVADLVLEVGREHLHGGRRGDQQRDQPQGVGDQVSGPYR